MKHIDFNHLMTGDLPEAKDWIRDKVPQPLTEGEAISRGVWLMQEDSFLDASPDTYTKMELILISCDLREVPYWEEEIVRVVKEKVAQAATRVLDQWNEANRECYVNLASKALEGGFNNTLYWGPEAIDGVGQGHTSTSRWMAICNLINIYLMCKYSVYIGPYIFTIE